MEFSAVSHSFLAVVSVADYTSGPQYFVKILVGAAPDPHIFTIHKYVITSRLRVFQNIINGEDLEDPPTVVLREVEPDIFASLVRWFYSRRIEVAIHLAASLQQLAKLWLLAERLRVPKIQNAVILNANSIELYGIIDRNRCEHIKTAFEYGITVIPRDSPLRHYLLDLFATAASGGDLTFHDQGGFLALLPDGIAKDALRAFIGGLARHPHFITFVRPEVFYFVEDPDYE